MKIELNHSGIDELLHSGGVKETIQQIARQRAASCGSGYSYDVKSMGSRVIASVFTETQAAYRDNLKNNTLAKKVL